MEIENKPSKACVECSRQFTQGPSETEHIFMRRIYCSRMCMQAYFQRFAAAHGIEASSLEKGKRK